MQWEYQIVVTRDLTMSGDPSSFGRENRDRETTVSEMNEYGAEGWELVNVLPAGAEWLAVFKRPKE